MVSKVDCTLNGGEDLGVWIDEIFQLVDLICLSILRSYRYIGIDWSINQQQHGRMEAAKNLQSTRDRILDAAEHAFGADGFSGVGMKAIAREAGVAQGLLHYHFDNKEGLYAAVIARRSGIINAERLAKLERVDLSSSNALTQILRAFLEPPLGEGGGGSAYARILAGLCAGDARDEDLVQEHYDETATRFIDAMQIAFPDASRLALSWGYSLAISTLVMGLSQSNRPERLADADVRDSTERDVAGTLIAYVEGGIRALMAQYPRN